MPDNSIIASTVRPVDLQPLTYTLQLNGGTEAVVTAAQPRPLDVLLEAHTISVGPSVETVVNIGAPRKVVSLLQFGTPGEDGADGDQLELRVTGDMLQWRLEGQVAWLDLVDLTTVVPGTLWGLIGGTLSNQTDLQAALDAKLDDTQATPTGLAVLGAADAAAGRTALAAAAAGANTDLTSVVLGNTGLSFKDVDGSNKITLTTTSDLTVDATLSFVMTASRVITISGNTELNQALLTSSTPQFAGVNVGHATDTTVGRTSAGVINVEGVNVLLANQMAVANGLATLDAGGKIPSGQLPAIAITSTFPVASQAAMLALTAETGDVAVRSDLNKSFILGGGGNPATLGDWIELLTPTDTVLSVNGQTGAVSLTTTDISEGGNLYFTTARVLATALTGFAAAGSRTAIVATDTILAAFGKVQKYLNDLSALAFSGNASDLAGTKTAAFISDFATAADARIAAASLDALNDVDLTGAVDGQVLKRVAGVWVPGTDLSGGGGGGLSDADYGDIVVSGGATVFTIDAGVVSYAKIQSVTANSVLARAAGTNGTVGEVALAASQLLGRGSTGDVAAIALGTGLSMSGATLNAVGGDVVGPASATDNAIARFDTTTGKLVQDSDVLISDTGEINLPLVSAPATPASNTMNVFAGKKAGRMMPKAIGPSGRDFFTQPFIGSNNVTWTQASGNGTTVTAVGTNTVTTQGTATTRNCATTNMATRSRRIGYVSAATAGQFAGRSGGAVNNQWTIGDGSGLGGFFAVFRFVVSDAATVSGARMFIGMRNATATPTNVEPSTLTNVVGLAQLSSSSNLHIVYGGSTAQTPIDLGSSFPANTLSVDLYELALFAPSNSQVIHYQVTRLNTGDVASGTLSGTVGTAVPAATTFLNYTLWRCNNATALAVGLDMISVYVETDN